MRFFLFLLSLFALGCSSNNDSYTEINVQNIRISYFKKYIKDDEAKMTAIILKNELKLNDDKRIYYFGIVGGVNGFTVCQYMRTIAKDRDDNENFYKKIARKLSSEVFYGSPVDYTLCDQDGKKVITFGFSPQLPELPIEVFTRNSVGGGGLVCQFKNITNKHLILIVNVSNKTLNTKKSFIVTVSPNSFVEHGWAEGWNYVSGDRIELTNADYETKVVYAK